jgi:hypothetical protein
MICNTKFSAAHTICIKKKKIFVKFFFTEIRFQNQNCADIDVEIAMSVLLLLLRMIFVSHQQKPLIHTHNNSFNSYEEEEEKRNFPIGVLELCFLFAVSKEKKELYYIS